MQHVVASNDALPSDIVPNLLSIAKAMRALHGIKLAKLGFHNGQDELLIAADTKGIAVAVLAESMSIRPSTVSKMMDRLVAKGLVERIGDPADRRRTLVRITPAGIEARSQLLQVRRELEADLTKSFGQDLCPSVAVTLVQCQTHLHRQLSRLR